MRKFIRHPASIPIEIVRAEPETQVSEPVKNVSFGGLACRFAEYITPNSIVHLKVNLVEPPCELQGKVVWCHKVGDEYELGLEFVNTEEAFILRMVEQICHIEHYRGEIRRNEGRLMSSEEAAREWIERYAEGFPGAG